MACHLMGRGVRQIWKYSFFFAVVAQIEILALLTTPSNTSDFLVAIIAHEVRISWHYVTKFCLMHSTKRPQEAWRYNVTLAKVAPDRQIAKTDGDSVPSVIVVF